MLTLSLERKHREAGNVLISLGFNPSQRRWERFNPLVLLVFIRSHPGAFPVGKREAGNDYWGWEALLGIGPGNRPTGTGAGQVAGDKHRLPLGDRAIGHVEPLHQLRAFGHGGDQLTLRQ